jgi:quercetin dioxygenase-like cupin family protein
MNEIVIPCTDLDEAIKFFTERLGFRVDMIMPADAPSVAVISGHRAKIRLEKSVPPAARSTDTAGIPLISLAADAIWSAGRAGMSYRDLIPGRLGGRVVASQIRLAAGGEVADYVHYHKVAFQMIYCCAGKVKVVYEDFGDPFWLTPGDCVLQPPEMRHRVLECEANTEVIELSSPASHETWADHEMILPTGRMDPDKMYGGQRFILHRAADAIPMPGGFGNFDTYDTGIHDASNGAARVLELRTRAQHASASIRARSDAATFCFVLDGALFAAVAPNLKYNLNRSDSITVLPGLDIELAAPANAKILCVIV